MTWNWMQRGAGSAALAATLVWCVTAPAEGAERAPERWWQASVQGRWFPGLGEAKGNVAESGAPEAGAGYALRLERRLSDWWSAGVGLSMSAWGVSPAGETGVLQSGSFVDALLVLKIEPLSLEIPGGPLSMYVTGSGGPTLSGDTRYVSGRSPEEAEGTLETVRFDAGLAAGASLGMSYRPASRLSVFVEAGVDWHYAAHARRTLQLADLGAPESFPPFIMERLWVGQGVAAAGVAYHF